MLKCGIDIIRINRLAEINPKIRERFIQRVFTETEQAQLKNHNESLSGVFAAKEAVSKALGTGIGFIAWREIEIVHEPSGEPQIHFHGRALEWVQHKRLLEWSVSISHEGGFAVAMAVAQSGCNENTGA